MTSSPLRVNTNLSKAFPDPEEDLFWQKATNANDDDRNVSLGLRKKEYSRTDCDHTTWSQTTDIIRPRHACLPV